MILLLMLATALEGCGGSDAVRRPSPVARAAPVEAPPAEPSGLIARAELALVLEGGLGRFLQGVETEPALDDGRFVGFRLISLYPDDPRFRDLDLEPGDVIVRVNGESIERPEQAVAVWNSLRVASELWIEYLRGRERRELRFPIVDSD
jgi:S1-C subfamily serine protease